MNAIYERVRFTRISVYIIAPEETRRQINVYTGGGEGVQSNLAARGQNKSEKWCCQITVRSSRTICNKDCSVSEIKRKLKIINIGVG